MTNEHAAHGGSTLVNTSSGDDVKRLLGLGNDGPITDQQIKDAILRNEEEKMMDEEITSLESNDHGVEEGEDDNIENAMLNVAIINSVVTQGEATINVVKSDLIPNSIVAHGNTLAQQQHTLNRYGLRQRPSLSSDSDGVEHIGAIPESIGGEVKYIQKRTTTSKKYASQSSSSKLPSTKSIPAAKRNPKPPRAAKRKRTATGNVHGTFPSHPPVYATMQQVHTSVLSSSQPPQAPSSFCNAITSVPNPLSNFLDTSLSQQPPSNTFLVAQTVTSTIRSPKTQLSYTGNGVLTTTEDTVPCPLSSSMRAAYIGPISQVPVMLSSNLADPPMLCPTSDQKQRVTFTEPTESRDRSFSIDLDMALGFSNEQIAGDGDELHIISGGGRNRAYSFECFAFGINTDEPLSQNEQSSHGVDGLGLGLNEDSNFTNLGRPRGDSIVFDQLRPREDSLGFDDISRFRSDSIVCDNLTTRPRGDSIIFDPTSFQDGGILEQRVLYDPLQSTAGVLVDHVDSLVDSLLHGVVTDAEPQIVTPVTGNANLAMQLDGRGSFASSINPVPVAANETVNSGLVQHQHEDASSNATVSCSTAIPYEILNKDGRIGIYLPDARRERIVRFLTKRNNRIWRKRIKYDCRKKLADSRPRIKGRFVKRADD